PFMPHLSFSLLSTHSLTPDLSAICTPTHLRTSAPTQYAFTARYLSIQVPYDPLMTCLLTCYPPLYITYAQLPSISISISISAPLIR
ncbi:hypothetical protein DFH06DRAFT_1226100, partial [Mycena polygramma]